MTVWLEAAFAENFILDGALLCLVNKTLRLPVKKGRIILSAALGSVFALIYPTLTLPSALGVVLRLSFGVFLPLVALPARGRAALFAVLLFYGYTFAYGGALLGLSFLLKQEWANGVFFLGQTPAQTVLALLPVFALAAFFLSDGLYKRWKRGKLKHRCTVIYGGKEVECIGLTDTGNRLTLDGKPVCLIDGGIARRLTKDAPPDYRTMEIHTATGRGKVKIFQADLRIYSEGKKNIIDKVYFAVGDAPIEGGFGIILQPTLCEEEFHV